LNKFTKNLIRFNDEINNVKTERKRKPAPKQKQDQENHIAAATGQENVHREGAANTAQPMDRRKGA
jgi:hypothetical protein